MPTRLLPAGNHDVIFTIRPFSRKLDMRTLGIWQFQDAYATGLSDHLFFKGTEGYYSNFQRDDDHRLYTLTYAGLPIIIAELQPAEETELLAWDHLTAGDLQIRLYITQVREDNHELCAGLVLILAELYRMHPERRLLLSAARFQKGLIGLLNTVHCRQIAEVGIISVYDTSGIRA